MTLVILSVDSVEQRYSRASFRRRDVFPRGGGPILAPEDSPTPAANKRPRENNDQGGASSYDQP
jgi:hypothetical protein